MHVAHLLIYIFIIQGFTPNTESTILDTIKQFLRNPSNAANHSQERTEPARPISEDHMDIIMQRINGINERTSIASVMKREAPKQLCDDNELMIFLAEIQVTNPESIINLSTQEELPVICKQVTDALVGIENYLKKCTLPNGRDLYLQLIKGVARFVDVMCEKETETKKAFITNFPCLKQLHTDFENCYGPADWTEDIKKHDICCAYKQIADCYFVKAAEVCGKPAARAMKKVVISIINVVIPVHCTIILEPCVDVVAPSQGSQKLCPNTIMVIILVINAVTTKLKPSAVHLLIKLPS